MTGLDVDERSILREELYTADEVFLTGTASEIVPVASVDRIATQDQAHTICTQLMQAYFNQFEQPNGPSATWLELV